MSDRVFISDERFVQGAESALDAFRAELISHRDNIESCDEPVFDVIIALLDRVLAECEGFAT